MGQKKRKKRNPFVLIPKSMIRSAAWQELSHPAVRAYIHIMEKFNGYNGDNLSLTYAEMEPYMQRRTFSKAIKQLEDIGFIKRVRYGGLMKHCNIFALNDDWTRHGRDK